MTNKIYLTSEGFLKLEEELDTLKRIKRPEVIKALKEARALGDLSENAEYDAARNEQAVIEGRIKEIEVMINRAIIIKEASTDKVDIGATVKLKYIDDEDFEEYKIVGSQEANPDDNKISNESPIARALLGAKKGQIVTVESPNGKYNVEVVEIC